MYLSRTGTEVRVATTEFPSTNHAVDNVLAKNDLNEPPTSSQRASHDTHHLFDVTQVDDNAPW